MAAFPLFMAYQQWTMQADSKLSRVLACALSSMDLSLFCAPFFEVLRPCLIDTGPNRHD